MEENEDKKPEENEPEVPEGTEEKPSEAGNEQPKEKGGKLDAVKAKAKVVKDKAKEKAKVVKQKTGEFMGVKRNRIIVLACSGAAIVALVVGLSVGLTQCHGSNGGDTTSSSSGESKGGEGSGSSAHTHDYGTAWKSDATQHWHECACGDKKDAASHTFSNERVVTKKATPTVKGKKGYQCTVCEYAKDEIEYDPYVTESNWEAAFKFDGDKFTFTYTRSNGSTDTVIKNGNAIYWYNSVDASQDEYFTKETEGESTKYYIYKKDSSGSWTKNEDTDDDKYYDWYGNRDFHSELFRGKLTYAGLTFNDEKQGYTASYKDGSEDVSAELYFNNARLIKAIKTSGGSSLTYLFSDEAEELNVPHVHDYGTEWKSDGTQHWHECPCGSKADQAAHSYGAAWEIKTKATSAAKGIKAHKCSVCGAFDEATQKEYDPFVDESKWSAALTIDCDFKLRKDVYYHYNPQDENTHEVTVQTRHGNVLKVTNDKYSYGDGFYYGGSVNWYGKVPDGDASYGFECYKYTYDEASAQWSSEGDAQWEWLDLYGMVDWSGYFSFSDYSFDEANECYTKSISYSGNSLTDTDSFYFDSGKLVKRVLNSVYDSGETKTTVYQIEYTTEELSLPLVGSSHTHNFSESYSSDSLYHWHECACGAKKDKAAHDLGEYQVTKAATKTESGTKVATCSTCSGTSGEREYTPYMDGFNWSNIFSQYLRPYRMTMTTVRPDGAQVTEKSFDGVTYKKSTWSTSDAAGKGAKQNEDTDYYLNGSPNQYDYNIAPDGGYWVKTTDPEGNWTNYRFMDAFSYYGFGDANSKDKYNLVEDGSDVHYARKDGLVDLHFDKGRIVKLHDTSENGDTTIVVEYDDIYEIELPVIGSAV